MGCWACCPSSRALWASWASWPQQSTATCSSRRCRRPWWLPQRPRPRPAPRLRRPSSRPRWHELCSMARAALNSCKRVWKTRAVPAKLYCAALAEFELTTSRGVSCVGEQALLVCLRRARLAHQGDATCGLLFSAQGVSVSQTLAAQAALSSGGSPVAECVQRNARHCCLCCALTCLSLTRLVSVQNLRKLGRRLDRGVLYKEAEKGEVIHCPHIRVGIRG